jgi:hypothetical protein
MLFVMPALVADVHAFLEAMQQSKAWMAGQARP